MESPINGNPETLNRLKQTLAELMSQAETLTNRVQNHNWKLKISQKIKKGISDFTTSVKDFEVSSKLSPKSRYNLNLLVTHLQQNIEMIFSEHNIDLEGQTIHKLFEVCKIQSSINKITEDIYRKSLENFKKTGKTKKTAKKQKSQNENGIILKNFAKIAEENTEFLQAVKKNLVEITNILRPNISKTIMLISTFEKYLPSRLMQKFSSEKFEIEKEYQSVISYVNSFFNVVDEFCENLISFERFSEISDKELSIHYMEQEIEFKNASQSFNTTDVEKQYQKSLASDQFFFNMIENEMQFDMENIKKLRKVIESVETEKNQIHRKSYEKNFGSLQSSLDFIVRTVNEILEILRRTIENRQDRIKSLKNFDEITPVYKHYERLEPNDSINDIKSSISEEFDESKYRISSEIISKGLNEVFNFGNHSESTSIEKINQLSKTLPKSSKTEENFGFNFNDSQTSKLRNLSTDALNQKIFDSEILLKKNSEQEEKIQKMIVQDSVQKKKINELLLENDRLLLSTKRLNNTKQVLSDLLNKLKMLKKLVNDEKNKFKTETDSKLKEFLSKMGDFNIESIRSDKGKMNELLESNEEFRAQTDALKNAFQIEVKKLNQENAESKKLNKDLKDSLLKISSKHESQNKIIHEICQILQVSNVDGLLSIKNFILTQQLFLDEIFSIFKERKTENLLALFKSQKFQKESGKFNQILEELETYTGTQCFQVLEFLKNKDAKNGILVKEIEKVFQENFRNIQQKIQESFDKNSKKLGNNRLRLRKLSEKIGEYKMQVNVKNNLLEQMTDNICDLEDHVQQNKWNEIEMNNNLNSKTKEFLHVTEEMNKLKISIETYEKITSQIEGTDCENEKCKEIRAKIAILKGKLSLNYKP